MGGDFNCPVARETLKMDGKPIIETITCVMTAPTSVTATLGNLLVLISIWRTQSLHTPSNFLLVSLALTDLGVGVIATPLFIVSGIAKIKQDPIMYCRSTLIYSIASYALCGISLLTLTAISLDRLIALRIHLRYKEIVTVNRVCKISVVIWLFGLLFGFSKSWNNTFVGYVTVIVIPLCIVVTAFCYCQTYRVVRRHQAQINAHLPAQFRQQERNSFKFAQFKKTFVSMLLIYLVFLLCYTPFLVVRVVKMTAGKSTSIHDSTSNLAVAFIHMNSSLNPVLYCWRLQNIRAAVKETARKVFKMNSSE